jgi:hypothetical protein
MGLRKRRRGLSRSRTANHDGSFGYRCVTIPFYSEYLEVLAEHLPVNSCYSMSVADNRCISGNEGLYFAVY